MQGAELYPHIRVVLGIILGLSITTLLKGVASIIEHPRRYGWSWIHMSWVVWALISVVTFWWWEFRLGAVPSWTFQSYLFVIAYCSLYFMLSALLFPADVGEYGSYEGYLIQRRGWFFGLIVLITLMDIADTALKGVDRWQALGAAYPIRTAVMLVIAGLGMALAHRRAQLVLALVALVYHVVYFTMEYFTVT
jgi:hypothetical protein